MKRVFKIISVCIILLIAGLFIFFQFYAKSFVLKQAKIYTGRTVYFDKLWINPLTGYVSITDFKIFEEDGQQEFFALDKIETALNLPKAFKNQWQLDFVRITNPFIRIIQTGESFNFSSMAERFGSEEVQTEVDNSEPFVLVVERLDLFGGQIEYGSSSLKKSILLDSVSLSSNRITTIDERYFFDLGCTFRDGGNLKSTLDFDLANSGYYAKIKLDDFNLNPLQPYVEDYLKIGRLAGHFHLDEEIWGSIEIPEKIITKGNIRFDDLLLTNRENEKVMAMSSFDVEVDSVDVSGNVIELGSIKMDKPFMLFELFDTTDNISEMMVVTSTADSTAAATVTAPTVDDSNIFKMLAGYLKDIAKTYQINSYAAREFSLTGGHISYQDYTLNDRFSYELEELNIYAGNVNSENEMLNFDLSTTLNRGGNFDAKLSISPKDALELELTASVNDMRLSDLTPYTTYYVAYPLVAGTLNFSTVTSIKNHQLNAQNHLLAVGAEVGKKQVSETAANVPMKLAVSLLKDRKGNIDLNIPVEGDLDDPKYKVWKTVVQILKNIAVKAVSSPYNALARMVDASEDDLRDVRFEMLQTAMDKPQRKSCDLLNRVLESNEDIRIQLYQVWPRREESEYWALWQAKKEFLSNAARSTDDETIRSLPNKDSLFVAYLDLKTGITSPSISVQEKALTYIGVEKTNSAITELQNLRRLAIEDYFKAKSKQIHRIEILNGMEIDSLNKPALPMFVVKYGGE